MQDRFQPTPQNAAEFRRPSTSWEDMLGTPLPPEIDTPEKRLSALVNIVQNGAQTLEVLTMSTEFATYSAIQATVNTRVGLRVVNSGTTYYHLLTCIEPIGAAARSTIDDKEWTLTPFGAAGKPALIFAWQQMLDKGLNAMDVFGRFSQGKKNPQGGWLTTTAMTRTEILASIPANGAIEIKDLIKTTKIAGENISRQCDYLAEAGFIKKRSVDTNEGESASHHVITKYGQTLDDWPAYVYPHQKGTLHTDSARVFEAVRELHERGVIIDSTKVLTSIDEKYGKGPKTRKQRVALILAHLAKEGILEYIDFRYTNFSEISLTDRGKQIGDSLILPLMLWSDDPYAAEEINEIRRTLIRNAHAYDHLFPQIAENFATGTHQQHTDPGERKNEIFQVILAENGKLTTRDIARILGHEAATIQKTISALVHDGIIRQQRAERGNRIYLFVV